MKEKFQDINQILVMYLTQTRAFMEPIRHHVISHRNKSDVPKTNEQPVFVFKDLTGIENNEISEIVFQ